ncbi:MAG: DUF6362 family protein [Candidatus Thiodiazotropha endolucinida]|nr:DUF6362 family protein [Candidatus Thiodiazotropha taylori]MCW4263693.1 DUF6362 family protein [Candidatus Thiodiazotropha endolucinida]
MDKTLLARVAALPNMPLSDLKALWRDVYQDEPPGGHKSHIVRTPEEIAAGEPMPLRLRATPDAISRMEQTLRWITWVDVEERRLIWHRAARRRWKTICWELGCDRSTAWRKWNVALAKIAARLNAGQK